MRLNWAWRTWAPSCSRDDAVSLAVKGWRGRPARKRVGYCLRSARRSATGVRPARRWFTEPAGGYRGGFTDGEIYTMRTDGARSATSPIATPPIPPR